ncbi:hypothetical protein [Clostridium celatum]|uniref:hypothetical protein n=1 Tax=Clostridium celatum TaxID=36834 RepID=UPI00290A97C6|nr:hypothetical protein [Clostridium celatum]MDU6297407.1 hypothetical protein [Clostridium celatum]
MLTRGRTGDQLRVLIENGRYETKEEMMEKLDVFLMGNRISTAEYQELVALLEKKEAKKEVEA